MAKVDTIVLTDKNKNLFSEREYGNFILVQENRSFPPNPLILLYKMKEKIIYSFDTTAPKTYECLSLSNQFKIKKTIDLIKEVYQLSDIKE